MLDRILGHDIATYVKAHRGLIILTIILSILSSLFVIVPAYLLQAFVDEGMKMASDPVEWRIPWLTFRSNWSIERTELVLVTGISPNRLLILLTGKSTLLDLIPRFYDVCSGSITIDGMDIRDATLDSLRGQIAIVSQESLLFHDTIAHNISYDGGHHKKEQIENAARIAQAHDFIMAFPVRYETVVGDRGTLLSGGQRQRIAIARAILKDPAILILDEPASALDPESELLIQEAIESLLGQRTIFIVSHRMNTIRGADRIYVLEDGRIVESGTHEGLIAANGRYRDLYDIQFRT